MHVDDMLASMTPDEFDERWAHWFVQPYGKEMEVASAAGAEILNAIRQATATEPIPDDQIIPLDFFLPKKADEGAQRTSTSGTFSSVMRQRIGV